MGAHIDEGSARDECGEPVADIGLVQGPLRAIQVGGEQIVTMIDELPLLAVAATQAEGQTIISDAAELRVKETDRIASTVEELTKLGAKIEARPDGMLIEGHAPLRGAVVDSQGDHRLAMALAVAALAAEGETVIKNAHVTDDSFPGFAQALRALGAEVEVC
jgi:3-phosphoshikimate 1-carboxyvinyltransferase